MERIPLSPALGAEIRDFDLGSQDDVDGIKSALDRHKLLLIRGRAFSDEDHVDLLGRFGTVMRENGSFYYDSAKDYVTYVTTKPGKHIAMTTAFQFHADYQFTLHGAAHIFSLCALEINRDESTVFANMVAAVDLLPAKLRARLWDLKVVQCVNSFSPSPDNRSVKQRFSKRDITKPFEGYVAIHPAIGPHHRTGEPVLNISQQFSSHFLGLSEDESQAIFEEIEAIAYSPSNIFRHHWQVDDMVVWDNIALQHARDVLDPNYARVLRRVVSNPVHLADMLQSTRDAAIDRRLAENTLPAH